MSSTITLVPDELYDLAAEADTWAVALREEAADVGAALTKFRSSSSEFVPALPDHAGTIAGIGDRVAALAESIGALAAAAEQADRDGVRLHDVLLAIAGGINLADKIVSGAEGTMRLLRFGFYSLRMAASGSALARLRLRWGSRAMPDIGKVRGSIPGGAGMPRSEVRGIQKQIYREIKGPRAAARRANANAVRGLRTQTPVTPVGGRVSNFLNTTTTGKVIKVGGKVLGAVGTVLSAYDAYDSFKKGDVEGGVTASVATVGGVLMMTGGPVGVAVGATLVVGALVYENREAIADAARSVVNGAGKLLGGLF